MWWGQGVQTDTEERQRRGDRHIRNRQTGVKDLKAQKRHPQTRGGVAVGTASLVAT